jgi:hypothetical protein
MSVFSYYGPTGCTDTSHSRTENAQFKGKFGAAAQFGHFRARSVPQLDIARISHDIGDD